MGANPSTVSALQRAGHGFRRSMATALFADGAVRGLTYAAAVWGAAVLAVRALGGTTSRVLAWASLLLPTIALLAGLLRIARRLPSPHQVRIALEDRSQAGGLIVAGGAPGHAAWRDRMPPPHAPNVVHHDLRRSAACLACLAFAAIVAWLPARAVRPAGAAALDVAQTLETLADQTATLAEEQIIDPETADALRQQLERLGTQASGDDPARTYEGLDHLSAALRQEAQRAAEALMARAEQLATFEALATLLAQAAEVPDPDAQALRQAISELSQMLAANPALADVAASLTGQLSDLLKDAQLTPAQLAELAKQLGQCQSGAQATLAKLCEARLLNPEALQKCRAACSGAASAAEAHDALLEYLAANPGSRAAALQACAAAGSGGVDRGGGPSAGLTWQRETTADGAGFAEQALPAAPGALEESQLVGVSLTAPDAPDAPATAAQGALSGAAPRPSEGWRRTLLPRHRAPVERYFDRTTP